MANTQREKLFTEFPAVATEQWEEVITADLKGADYERKLVWKTGEGFNVRPYYRAENLEGIRFLGSQAGEFPFVRGTRAHNRWHVHQTVKVENPAEANAEALKMLNAGIDSIEFRIDAADFSDADLDALLAGISIPAVELVFSGSKCHDLVDQVLAKIAREGIAREEAHIHFCIDPLVKGLTSKGVLCSCIDGLADLVRKTADYKHIRVVTVSGHIFSNAGSTIVEELAFTLAAGHDYLVRMTEGGIDADKAARKIRFAMNVTSNYFMEMAKFRAARMLWANIVKAYGPEKECACKMFTHAVTSAWNQTVYDPYVNMLRGTTEAMSASIAGVHSLEVLPFDASYEEPDEFSKRIARNAELLLKHESHFDQVVDPAGGSYYIETLTQSIAAEAWKLFLEIEEKGGYTAAYEAGFIVERVKASAAAKDKAIATRRQILLGANQYPNFTETADAKIGECAVERAEAKGNVLRWPSSRCVCTWTAAARHPRLSCSPAAAWPWPVPAHSSRATSSPAPASRCRTTRSSSRSKRAWRPHWPPRPTSWWSARATTTTPRPHPASRSSSATRRSSWLRALRPAHPSWRLRASPTSST